MLAFVCGAVWLLVATSAVLFIRGASEPMKVTIQYPIGNENE